MTRNGWETTDYLTYGIWRASQYLRSGLAGQLAAGALTLVAWIYMADHKTEVKRYIGAAVPRFLVPKVHAGGHVTAEVSSNAVRFVETTAGTHAEVVLGTFPRGLGYAHLGTATAISQSVLHRIVPWVPLALLAWVLVAMVRTILGRRLLPSASDYVLRGRRRAMGQVFVRRGEPPRLGVVRIVTDDETGSTLADWARHNGGDGVSRHGLDNIDRLVADNRTRRQPTFGTVIGAETRLRSGWELFCSPERDPPGQAIVSNTPDQAVARVISRAPP